MNESTEEYRAWWEGVMKEQEAKADKMDAEARMAHNKMLQDFRTEAEAGKDWLAADWEQFKARVQQWTNAPDASDDA